MLITGKDIFDVDSQDHVDDGIDKHHDNTIEKTEIIIRSCTFIYIRPLNAFSHAFETCDVITTQPKSHCG